MVLITMLLAQAGLVANAAETQGKYAPRTNAKATVSSYMKSIRANQETGLIDPALQLMAQKAANSTTRANGEWKVMGPDNYGALTRAMVYDQNDATNNTLLIGTMGGHIFKSTNGGITMQQVYDLNTMISCMVQINGTTFVGTGDGRFAEDANGLADLGYETSFIGQGIYKIANNEVTLLESTKPTADNGWGFINEMAPLNGGMSGLYAATEGGLYYSVNNGESWVTLMEGRATAVRTNGTYALAIVDQEVFVITWANNTPNIKPVMTGEDNMLPIAAVEKTIAVSKSDVNFMYVCYLTTDYKTGNIYYTNDGGATWKIAVAQTDIYNIHVGRGYIDNAMEVFPNNPRKLLIGGANVWTLEDATSTGVYRPVMVSEGQANELQELANNSFIYVHTGIQNFVFNPDNANVFFVGTEGGVFKGTYAQQTYSFMNSNRYFITENNHTSVARMFGVGVSGLDDMVLGGSLDHGTIMMEGSELLNSITTGRAIFPNCDPTTPAAGENGHGIFTEKYAGGQCAVSTISPAIMFVTSTGSMTTPLYRTQTAGQDYDMSNFYNADNTASSVIVNPDAFRTPFAMYENYNDTYSTRTTMYAPTDTIHHAGETVLVRSAIADYPFEYVLPVDVNKGDTLEGIQDIISATMICAVKTEDKETGNIYMTRNSHVFNELSEWWKVYATEGLPTVVAMSTDGDMAMVGTATGNLYRLRNLKQAVAANLACVDSTDCVIDAETLDNTLFAGRTITGISIVDNEVLLTLGNYGNTDYVFRSTNGGDTFTSIQNNLEQFPVYSCVIEKGTHTLFVGTEYGIYTLDGSQWKHQGDVTVPVTDMKQATLTNRPHRIIVIGYDNGTPIVEISYGITNEGVIYASTYGNGIVKCNDYRVGGSDYSVDENTVADNNALQMNIYPNPVRGNGNINFELTESASVSYQIYDLSGRMVSSRVLGTYAKGENTVSFSTENLASGSYIVRIQAGNKVNSSKIMVF